MSGPLTFNVSHRLADSEERVGVLEQPHGEFDTPAYMPVGTKASVKGLLPHVVRSTGSQIILNNAYHLMLRPGDDLIARRGGVHRFMGWDGPILTDSGGYQAFSMADCNSIDDQGVVFQSIIDGARIELTPERAIEVQNNLGADIIMAFDDCPPSIADSSDDDAHPDAHAARLSVAVDRTTAWLHRCIEAHTRSDEQALFGIIQGGTDQALRERSLAEVTACDLPGYAIGGVAVGESPALIHDIVAKTAPQLPADRPRYLMGVGYERDIVQAVRSGVDMFDCVLPTRNGRSASAFTRTGRINLKNAQFREDESVIEPGCSCLACSGAGIDGEPPMGYSRAYLRHLFLAGEMLGPILVSVHNIHHFQTLMLDIRGAIRDDAWLSLERDWPVLREVIGAP
ncbi:MAG: tRNA guanosine(34) transglycosylase Tgt [Phycisphaerales bacterium]|nr:tRNA guanosine(34) transglycosylase Tgt [Phycisphaerales bacterium]